MDETFLKLLQEMANMPDVPCDSHEPENPVNASAIAANQKAEQLDDYVTDTSFGTDATMPAYLKSQIIDRVHQPDIRHATERSTPKSPISKRLELFFYSCKVAGAVAAAFAIMIASAATQQWIRENDSSFSFGASNTGRQWNSRTTNTEKSTIRITENLGKSSSAFTGWLQTISDFLVNNRDDGFDT